MQILVPCDGPQASRAVPSLYSAQTGTGSDYRIKAAFLLNFAQFVTWSPGAFSGPNALIVIGILGDDPFGSMLEETLQGEKVGARSVHVERYKRAGGVGCCHILFISHSEAKQLESILSGLADFEDSARRGVMIRFMTENPKIRLRINLETARAAGLTISSKLLRPAEIVSTGMD